MKLTLTITASASALAHILASLPNDASVTVDERPFTPTGAGTPVVPVPSPSVPSMGAPIPIAPSQPMMPQPTTGSDDGDEEGDDGGPAGDGQGFDADGLPWDERIHSGNKKQGANGKWMSRRGGPKGDERAKIEAELRASITPAPVPLPVTPIPQPTVATIAQQPVPQMQQPVMQPVAIQQPMADPVAQPAAMQPMMQPVMQPPVADPVQPAMQPVMQQPVSDPTPQVQPVAEPQPALTGQVTFEQFMDHLTEKMKQVDGNGQPLVHASYLANITTEISNAYQMPQPMTAIMDLQSNPDKIGYAIQLLQRDGRW